MAPLLTNYCLELKRSRLGTLPPKVRKLPDIPKAPAAKPGKRDCSQSESNQAQKRKKETVKSLGADIRIIKQQLALLAAAALNKPQQDSRPAATHQENPTSERGAARAEIPDVVEPTKFIVMGNSPIATRVTAELDDSIIMNESLGQLRTALDATTLSVKVAIMDYTSTEGPQSILPDELRLVLNEARTMVCKPCLDHKHAGQPCEMIIFKTLPTPADYV